MKSLAWHYTVGVWFAKIESAGVLRPATEFVEKRERPVVWFTTRDTFEPTAVKLWRRPDGTLERLSVEETERRGRGLFRIGIEPDGLSTWDEWRKHSRVRPTVADALERVAEDQGSDVSEWLVSFRPVPARDWKAVEVWYRRRWQPIGR